jgi:RIO kinase 1
VDYLRRDVYNISGWFRGRGLAPELADPESLLATLLGAAF